MKIGSLNKTMPDLLQLDETKKSSGKGFGNVFTEFVNGVNQDQVEAGKITEKFINGDGIELHEVMIAGEKAKTSLDLLIEIRNKAIDMYRELTRM